ncbi:DNA/RNA non-specific endonuclease [Aquimarina sp. 2-A2]|uniref:DNA/RNA non-specific endonuclease n=1 Tax=Aquimarina sp. 2-A2 TaxID=3382644 RepID=UPI00387F352D
MDFYLNWHNHINIGTSETLALAGGGPSEQINYFSQNATENRSGAWYQMEKAISDMIQSPNPPNNIKIEMEFNFNGSSKRPDSIDVDIFMLMGLKIIT